MTLNFWSFCLYFIGSGDSRHTPPRGVCVVLGIGYRTICRLGSTPIIEFNPQSTDFLLRLATLCGARNWNLESSYMNFLSPGVTGVPPPHQAQDRETNERGKLLPARQMPSGTLLLTGVTKVLGRTSSQEQCTQMCMGSMTAPAIPSNLR